MTADQVQAQARVRARTRPQRPPANGTSRKLSHELMDDEFGIRAANHIRPHVDALIMGPATEFVLGLQ